MAANADYKNEKLEKCYASIYGIIIGYVGIFRNRIVLGKSYLETRWNLMLI